MPDSVGAQVRVAHVILHGDVESDSQRDAAESAVRHLTGVRVVDNLIKVKTQTEPSDADVECRVREAIGRTANFQGRSIRVRIDNGSRISPATFFRSRRCGSPWRPPRPHRGLGRRECNRRGLRQSSSVVSTQLARGR